MTTPDPPTVGELVQVLIHRYKDAAPSSAPVSQPAARSCVIGSLVRLNYPSDCSIAVICVCCVHLYCLCFAVDGTWGSWQPWGECSSSCGGGQRTRARLCDGPSPSDGGRPCPGDSTQLSRCNTQACPGNVSLKKSFCVYLLYLHLKTRFF